MLAGEGGCSPEVRMSGSGLTGWRERLVSRAGGGTGWTAEVGGST